MLVEVHILQNHAPSNLNRDDTGSPKEAVFGGHKRARISSQCLKRSVRRSEIFRERLGGDLATRTRSLPELVRERAIAAGIGEELAGICASKASGFGTEKGTERKPNKSERYRTAQTMLLTNADIDAVSEVVISAAKEANGNAKKLEKVTAKLLQEHAEDKGFRPMTVDICLFGRMVTSEAFLDIEASSQFAHAISTHKIDHEFDYFTAVDDLVRDPEDEAGSGSDMIGDVEFNSACFYKYFNVHIDGLIDNLTGRAFNRDVTEKDEKEAREMAGEAVRALIEGACRVSPSGKQNTFAAHQPPSVVWVEIRDRNLPVSYANAFCRPVNPKAPEGLEGGSAKALKKECETLARMYGLDSTLQLLLAKDDELEIMGVKSSDTLKTVLDAVESAVSRG